MAGWTALPPVAPARTTWPARSCGIWLLCRSRVPGGLLACCNGRSAASALISERTFLGLQWRIQSQNSLESGPGWYAMLCRKLPGSAGPTAADLTAHFNPDAIPLAMALCVQGAAPWRFGKKIWDHTALKTAATPILRALIALNPGIAADHLSGAPADSGPPVGGFLLSHLLLLLELPSPQAGRVQ